MLMASATCHPDHGKSNFANLKTSENEPRLERLTLSVWLLLFPNGSDDLILRDKILILADAAAFCSCGIQWQTCSRVKAGKKRKKTRTSSSGGDLQATLVPIL
jgi:hypothetical protein